MPNKTIAQTLAANYPAMIASSAQPSVAGQTLELADLSMDAGGLLMEDAPGGAANGFAEVSITINSDNNPELHFVFDNNGATPPDFIAGMHQLVIATGNLKVVATAGNYTIKVVTTLETHASSPPSGDLSNTALVTHQAAIQSGTPAGVYHQMVTYTITANF
ncbi:MAG: hypothetical protein ACOCXT_02725 [Candidatus Dojkabacteria bacterium]